MMPLTSAVSPSTASSTTPGRRQTSSSHSEMGCFPCFGSSGNEGEKKVEVKTGRKQLASTLSMNQVTRVSPESDQHHHLSPFATKMVSLRLSNNLIGVLNIITFLLSIPILGAGIWLSSRGSTDCENFFDRPVIALGVILMVVSLAGLIGACCHVSWLLWFYLLVMFLLIVLLFCFTVFAFVITNNVTGEIVSGRGYKEYRLGDYSNWLQKRVNNNRNWAKIRSCIRDSKVCGTLSEKHQTFDQFIKDKLSPIQSGCCKPPTACNFTFTSETMWNKPQSFTNSSISDCNTWQNDPSILCYDCQSCKAGVLANLKDDWKKVAVVNIIFLILLVIVYSIGCCAFRNNRLDNNYSGWKRGP